MRKYQLYKRLGASLEKNGNKESKCNNINALYLTEMEVKRRQKEYKIRGGKVKEKSNKEGEEESRM